MGSKRIDYTLKEEYDLSLIPDEYLHILQEKNKGKSFEEIASEFGQSWANVRTKAKSAIDILQGKKSAKKICQNCGKGFYANSNSAKYCDDCKNGKIYMPGHDNEEYGELKVNAVYRYQDKQYAECTCSCGKKCEMRYDSLKEGKTTSCGHVNEKNLFKPYDLSKKINRYGVKALYQTGEKNGTSYIWHCMCSCGKEFDVSAEDFERRKSCGHAQDEARKNNVKVAKKEFDKYTVDGTNAIVITQKTPKNNTSGVKGVRWDNERKKWISEITFKGKRYYLGRYYSIEDAAEVRKIAEDNTFKDFLKWFSEEFPLLYKKLNTEQELNEENEDLKRIREIRSRNRKNKEHIINYKGETKTLKEWCKDLDLEYSCILQRLNVLGWSVEKALEAPVRRRK